MPGVVQTRTRPHFQPLNRAFYSDPSIPLVFVRAAEEFAMFRSQMLSGA